LRDDEKEPLVNENVDETMENLEKAFGDFKEDAMALMDTVATKQTTAVMDRDDKDEMLSSDEEQHSPKALANKFDQVHIKAHEDANLSTRMGTSNADVSQDSNDNFDNSQNYDTKQFNNKKR
jgi:hypothetical protein